MYQFIEASMFLQFVVAFVLIFITLAFFICWFMEFETAKTNSNFSRKNTRLYEELDAAKFVSDKALEAFKELSKEIEETKKECDEKLARESATICRHRESIKQLEIDFTDHLDNIAEVLGTRVTLKGWQKKTVAGKMAIILKKIQKLR